VARFTEESKLKNTMKPDKWNTTVLSMNETLSRTCGQIIRLKTELFLTVTDVDECAEQNGGCPQNCTNNVGNHTCSCFSGYTDVYDNGTLCTGNDYTC